MTHPRPQGAPASALEGTLADASFSPSLGLPLGDGGALLPRGAWCPVWDGAGRGVHPLYFTGVHYSFVVNAIKFCWRIIVMTRLFTIYLSPDYDQIVHHIFTT